MSSPGINLKSYLIPLEEIKRATENFSQQRCIGGGGFGAVFKGHLSEGWQNGTVAIKRLGRDSHQGEREFRNELEMISRLHHENIISFVGYCDEDNEMIIVYEYAINGSLDHHLQDPNKMRCITWTQRLQICIGAARGLNHLHSGMGEYKRVIHRDVKSANILLDGNLVAKICDFGLSKLGLRNQPDTQINTKVAGTQFYLDPTYHESHILRKESDVYSFGVVLFEIMSGVLVYHERSVGDDDQRQFLMNFVRRYYQIEPDKIIDPHIRDEIDSRSFYTFQEIAYRCISFNIKERPTLETVIERIEEALTIHTSERLTSTSAEGSVIEDLLRNLDSASPYDQRTAAGEICFLMKAYSGNRDAFSRSGAIPLFTELLTSSDTQTQEHAITALLNFSICEANKGKIVSCGAIPNIVHILTEGSLEARENAATTILNLSVIYKNKAIISDAGAIPPLVVLLKEGTQTGKKDAATALSHLCVYHRNNMEEGGAIGNLLPDEDELLSGIMDGLDLNPFPNHHSDGIDLFGGMELDPESESDNPKVSLGDGIATNGIGTVAGEHPYGEHPSRTLFVRNINSDVEDSELRILFEQYGDIRTLYTACRRMGFAMISYYDIRAARTAMRSLQNKPLRRRKLLIHYSNPKYNPSDKDMNQGTLAVFNLDPSVSREDLFQIFGAYGEVKEIRETPHKRHHKFVEYYDVRAAEAALRSLNRSDIAGKRIKLEPSRPGGARRNLMLQINQEFEQDDTPSFGLQVGTSIASSPPGVWPQFGSPIEQHSPLHNLSNSLPGLASFGGSSSTTSGIKMLSGPQFLWGSPSTTHQSTTNHGSTFF